MYRSYKLLVVLLPMTDNYVYNNYVSDNFGRLGWKLTGGVGSLWRGFYGRHS